MVLEAQVGEQAGVHARVQRLHATAERLGEAGDGRDIRHGEAGVADRRRGRAGRDDLDAGAGEGLGEPQQVGLVAHRHERAADRDDVAVTVQGRVVARAGHGGSSECGVSQEGWMSGDVVAGPRRGEVELAGGDAPDDVDQQAAFDGLDAVVEGVLVVAREHGDALLREDRARCRRRCRR